MSAIAFAKKHGIEKAEEIFAQTIGESFSDAEICLHGAVHIHNYLNGAGHAVELLRPLVFRASAFVDNAWKATWDAKARHGIAAVYGEFSTGECAGVSSVPFACELLNEIESGFNGRLDRAESEERAAKECSVKNFLTSLGKFGDKEFCHEWMLSETFNTYRLESAISIPSPNLKNDDVYRFSLVVPKSCESVDDIGAQSKPMFKPGSFSSVVAIGVDYLASEIRSFLKDAAGRYSECIKPSPSLRI